MTLHRGTVGEVFSVRTLPGLGPDWSHDSRIIHRRMVLKLGRVKLPCIIVDVHIKSLPASEDVREPKLARQLHMHPMQLQQVDGQVAGDFS